MLCFVLVTALMAKSLLVVLAEQAWVLKIWLWPSVAEKVSPSKVLHYCKQSLQECTFLRSTIQWLNQGLVLVNSIQTMRFQSSPHTHG